MCVTKFNQTENKTSSRVFDNAFSIDVMIHAWERKFVYCWYMRDSQCIWRLFVRESNATNFSKRNKNKTKQDMTVIPHDISFS